MLAFRRGDIHDNNVGLGDLSRMSGRLNSAMVPEHEGLLQHSSQLLIERAGGSSASPSTSIIVRSDEQRKASLRLVDGFSNMDKEDA